MGTGMAESGQGLPEGQGSKHITGLASGHPSHMSPAKKWPVMHTAGLDKIPTTLVWLHLV